MNKREAFIWHLRAYHDRQAAGAISMPSIETEAGYDRVLFKILTGGTFIQVSPFACPSSKGNFNAFAPVE